MWQVHTFQSSWKNTKHPDPMLDVREHQCLYYNKNRLSYNCPHHNTYTHIHRACAQGIIVHYSSSMTTASQGRCEYTSNSATRFCQNASIFSKLFISFSLLTSFPLMLGQMRMSLLRFGRAKQMLSCLTSRGAVHHALTFKARYFPRIVVTLTQVLISKDKI